MCVRIGLISGLVKDEQAEKGKGLLPYVDCDSDRVGGERKTGDDERTEGEMTRDGILGTISTHFPLLQEVVGASLRRPHAAPGCILLSSSSSESEFWILYIIFLVCLFCSRIQCVAVRHR